MQRQPIQVAPFARRRLLRRCFIDLLMGTWIQWIGLRENLQETIDFPIKYGAFL